MRAHYQTEKGKISHRNHISRYAVKYPQKIYAVNLLNRAVKSGEVERGDCEICGETQVEGHHGDYNKPLEVRWLCPRHHRWVHR